MSSMEIYGVNKDGDVVDVGELRNAFQGAAMVWTRLGEKYLGKYDYEKDARERDAMRRAGKDPGPHDPSGWRRTWNLQSSPKITDAEWCVLMSTFDNCIVPAEHFDYVADSFEAFDREFPGHYGECARIIRKFRDDGFLGYCVNATSVNQNPWWVPGGDDEDVDGTEDQGRAYNINTGKKHWFLAPTMRAELIAKAEK